MLLKKSLSLHSVFRLCKGVFHSCPFLVLGAISEWLSHTKVFSCHQCEDIQVLGFPAQLSWAFERWYNKKLQSLLELLVQASLWLRWLLMGHNTVVTGRERGWNVCISMRILNNISVWFCMPVWVYANDSFKIISVCASLCCQNISRFCGHKAKSYISFRLWEAEIIKSF